jgi:hypothetical protein
MYIETFVHIALHEIHSHSKIFLLIFIHAV